MKERSSSQVPTVPKVIPTGAAWSREKMSLFSPGRIASSQTRHWTPPPPPPRRICEAAVVTERVGDKMTNNSILSRLEMMGMI